MQKYEVKKTIRFELLPFLAQNIQKMGKKEIFNPNFLKRLLNYQNKLQHLTQTPGWKKLQDNINPDILQNWVNSSFDILTKYLLNKIWLETAYKIKPKDRKKKYVENMKNQLDSIISDYIPNYADYIPNDAFIVPKESEVFNAIKLIATLIIENDLANEEDKDLLEKIKNFNPNWESFYDVNTLNPYTANRKKKEEIEQSYQTAMKEFEKELEKALNIAKAIQNKILESEVFNWDITDKTLKYFKYVLENNNTLQSFDDLIFFQSKVKTFLEDKKLKKNFKKQIENVKNNIKHQLEELNKEIWELNKIISTINWYKINLLDNFSTKWKYSFLVKDWNYYFVIYKEFEKLSDFTIFFDNLPDWNAKAIWINSMTWWGFDKLFLSPLSDIKFKDGSEIKDFEEYKEILELKKKRFELQIGKKEEIRKLKRKIKNNLEKNLSTWNYDELTTKFLDYLKDIWKDTTQLFKQKWKKKKFNYWKELNDFIESLPEIKAYDEDEIEKQLLQNIISLLNKIKHKEYEVWKWNYQDLSFLWDLPGFESIEELKNYFNDKGYSLKQKNVDLNYLLEEAKKWKLKIYQLKNKDLPYHPNFVNEQTCGKPQTALNNKKLNWNKKDLFTLYWENFWEDIENWNENVRLWADFVIRIALESWENNNFWKKEKNKYRYGWREEEINNFKVRYKRNRILWEFRLSLNATNHTSLEKFNEVINKNLKQKLENNWKLTILALDHWENEFLTYKVFNFYTDGRIEEVKELEPASSFDDWKLSTNKNDINKKQEPIQCEENCSVEYQLENYITRYKLITEEKKRERQVQQALKHFASELLKRIKEIVSNDRLDKNKPDVSNYTLNTVKNFINFSLFKGLDISKIKSLNEDSKKVVEKLNIFNVLNNFYFDYFKYNFEKLIPDQKNLKEIIDKYINWIKNFIEDEKQLKEFLIRVKMNFWKLKPDEKLYADTPFFAYKEELRTSLANINNFKKWYASVLVGYIAKLLQEGKIDLIVVENNLISYGMDNAKTSTKQMWTANHPTFMQALINKLSFVMDKQSKQNSQYCYKTKPTELKKLKWKQNWVIVFVDENATSIICPKCNNKLCREKWNWKDRLVHKEKYKSWKNCYKLNDFKQECNFEIDKKLWKSEKINWIEFKNWDDLATYNIARFGFDYLKNIFKNN